MFKSNFPSRVTRVLKQKFSIPLLSLLGTNFKFQKKKPLEKSLHHFRDRNEKFQIKSQQHVDQFAITESKTGGRRLLAKAFNSNSDTRSNISSPQRAPVCGPHSEGANMWKRLVARA